MRAGALTSKTRARMRILHLLVSVAIVLHAASSAAQDP